MNLKLTKNKMDIPCLPIALIDIVLECIGGDDAIYYSGKWKKFDPTEVCRIAQKNKWPDLLDWGLENNYPCPHYIAADFAAEGNPDMLKYVVTKGGSWGYEVCQEACRMGYLNILKWGLKNGGSLGVDFELILLRTNNKKIIKYLIRKGHTSHAKLRAVAKEHKIVVRYSDPDLIARDLLFDNPSINPLDISIKKKDIENSVKAINLGFRIDDIIWKVDLMNMMEYLKFLDIINYEFDIDICFIAVCFGRLDILKWAYGKGYRSERNLLEIVIQCGYVAITNWLIQNGFYSDTSLLELFIKNYNVTGVRLLCNNGYENLCEEKLGEKPFICNSCRATQKYNVDKFICHQDCTYSKKMKMLLWLTNTLGCKFSIDTWELVVQRDNLDILMFMRYGDLVNGDLCELASKFNSSNIMRWTLEIGRSFDEDVCMQTAISFSSFGVIEILLGIGVGGWDLLKCLEYANKIGNVDAVKWLDSLFIENFIVRDK